MEIVSSLWHVVSAFLIFLLGCVLVVFFGGKFGVGKVRCFFIYLWHTMFSFIYLWYALSFGADAIFYFNSGSVDGGEVRFGTAGVSFLTAFLVQGLGVSILGAFLAYNVFGSIGLVAVDGSLRVAVQGTRPFFRALATLIVFLPSISFWSSAIGKDSISFMATGIALWAALDLGKRGLLMGFAILMMLIVRPHMAGLMVLGLAFSVVFSTYMSPSRRLLYGVIAISVSAILVPFALRYAGVGDSLTIESISEYIEDRQIHNLEGGGAVDIATMSMPMKLFTYMFRPVFFEVDSVFSLAAAMDNAILFYLFIAGGWALLRYRTQGYGNRVFMWAYALMAWGVLAMTTANLGIALRQKWMFAPMLIFLLISVVGKKRGTLSSTGRRE